MRAFILTRLLPECKERFLRRSREVCKPVRFSLPDVPMFALCLIERGIVSIYFFRDSIQGELSRNRERFSSEQGCSLSDCDVLSSDAVAKPGVSPCSHRDFRANHSIYFVIFVVQKFVYS